jgi:uncharacterized membrane protein
MNKLKRNVYITTRLFIVATVLTVVITSLYKPTKAYADVNDFTISDFAADYYLSNKDPQGEMRVVERINVNFTDQNHGILRALPESYDGHSLRLHDIKTSSDSGAPSQFSTYGSNGNKVLKIGDANRTVTGLQEYTVEYTVDNVIKFYNGAPQLYWNINGIGWNQDFDHVGATIHVPPGLHLSSVAGQQLDCYAGSLGQRGSDCSIAMVGDTIKADTTKALGPAMNLSVVAGFSVGYFKPAGLSDIVADYWKPVVLSLLLPLLTLVYCWRRWSKLGRDSNYSRRQYTTVPEYTAPDDLNPVEVAAIAQYKVERRDISALIIDLAVKGYIRIVEIDKKQLLKKTTEYKLQLLKIDFAELQEDEKALIMALFTDPVIGQERVINGGGDNSLFKSSESIRERTVDRLTAAGYFPVNPKSVLVPSIIANVCIVGVTAVLAYTVSVLVIIGGAVALIISVIFMRIMPARTQKGADAQGRIEGLKLYLQTAEADRIKMLQGPNAAYAANHNEPTRSVDLFEKLLPYAMVLGVEKEWAKQFEGLYTQPPDWYAGNYTAFSTGYLVGSLNSGFAGAVNSSFAAPSGSSSSGFGGGGFSGGGGGGGGGGGW